MLFIKNVGLTALFAMLSYFSLPYLPWYGIGFIAMVVVFFNSSFNWKTAIIYFALGFGIWYFMAQFQDAQGQGIISSRMGVLFGNQSPFVMKTASGLVGGITSLLGAFVGGSLKHVLYPRKIQLVEKK